jgi:hypothetical protein
VEVLRFHSSEKVRIYAQSNEIILPDFEG